MGTGSSAARGFEGVDPAKRQQAPPPRRYADPARYDWIPVEGDPDPADVAAASEAPPDLAVPGVAQLDTRPFLLQSARSALSLFGSPRSKKRPPWPAAERACPLPPGRRAAAPP